MCPTKIIFDTQPDQSVEGRPRAAKTTTRLRDGRRIHTLRSSVRKTLMERQGVSLMGSLNVWVSIAWRRQRFNAMISRIFMACAWSERIHRRTTRLDSSGPPESSMQSTPTLKSARSGTWARLSALHRPAGDAASDVDIPRRLIGLPSSPITARRVPYPQQILRKEWSFSRRSSLLWEAGSLSLNRQQR